MIPEYSKSLIDTEIEFERRIAEARGLAMFRRNPTTWELLLLLASAPDGYTEGLHEVPNTIRTRYIGSSALLKFIREQRDAGSIRFLEHEKRSKRILQADGRLVEALLRVLEWRNGALLDVQNTSTAPVPNSHPADGQRPEASNAGRRLFP